MVYCFPRMEPAKTVFYKRSNFVTHLPSEYLYSPSHLWISPAEGGLRRVGFTKFATRMLGEIVDYQFEKSDGDPVASGEIIGSVEGFKAITDLYCIGDGKFAGGNPVLRQNIALIGEKPYAEGWLYALEGEPDTRCVDLESYRKMLDTTIDRILETQKGEDG